MNTTRVLIACNYTLISAGLKAILENAGVQVMGECAVSESAVQLVHQLRPDIVLVNVRASDPLVLALFKPVLDELPRVRMIVLSDEPNSAFALEVLRSGVRAYLTHASALQELTRAITTVMEGQVYLCPSASGALVEAYRAQARSRKQTAHEQI